MSPQQQRLPLLDEDAEQQQTVSELPPIVDGPDEEYELDGQLQNALRQLREACEPALPMASSAVCGTVPSSC